MPDGIQTALGLVTLLVAAEWLVRGAVWVALVSGMKPMTVGLTLVAFGTSAPELVVSLNAAIDGEGDLAVGTVLGSNLANILLVIGIAAAVRPITGGKTSRFEFSFMLVMAMLAIIPLALPSEIVPRWLGMVMILNLVIFTWWLLILEKRGRSHAPIDVPPTPAHRGLGYGALHILLLILGAVGLQFGGDWLVTGASGLAVEWGMSKALVGMTIVAIGTSLPELATSAIAAAKGHPELSIGNVVGSNIFNVGMVLGITSVIRPLPMTMAEHGPALFTGLVGTLLLIYLLRIRKFVPRTVGCLFLIGYAGFLTLEVLRKH